MFFGHMLKAFLYWADFTARTRISTQTIALLMKLLIKERLLNL